MKILHKVSGREARSIKGINDPHPVFKCFPSGSKKNLDINAVKFKKIEEAAEWLRKNTKGGIRVASVGTQKGQRTAILNSGLIILHDDGKVESL